MQVDAKLVKDKRCTHTDTLTSFDVWIPSEKKKKKSQPTRRKRLEIQTFVQMKQE